MARSIPQPSDIVHSSHLHAIDRSAGARCFDMLIVDGFSLRVPDDQRARPRLTIAELVHEVPTTARRAMSTITSRSGYAAAWAAAVALLLTAPVRAADPSAIALDREPCVTVQAEGAGQIDPTGHRQRVVALATLRDGRRLTELFPYEWTYANPARDNPFFRANAFRTDLPVRIQRPRRPLDPRTVSPLIAFVLEHTGADGHFHGRACTPWSGAEDRTFAGRVSEHQVPERIAHATDDNLVVQIALVQKGAGPITVCAVARNIGKKPVERVRLRWDFKLRSGTSFKDVTICG